MTINMEDDCSIGNKELVDDSGDLNFNDNHSANKSQISFHVMDRKGKLNKNWMIPGKGRTVNMYSNP